MTRHAETLVLEGPDAANFAQAQFGSNVASLDQQRWQFSAWLNPQGRVRGFFHLARINDDAYLLLLRGGSSAAMAEALGRFVFRSKLAIKLLSPRMLSAGPALELHSVLQQEGTILLGCGTHSLRISDEADRDKSWHLQQLRLGWPWLSDASLDQLLPAQLSLQRLGAVAVDKGCYPGQEIVARLHFRGGNKRHLCSGILSQACKVDDLLHIEGIEAARIINVIQHEGTTEALIILRDDIAAQASKQTIVFAEQDVSMQLDTIWPA